MNNNNQCIIFLHIPRTGGTTLHSIIDRQYRKKEIFNTYEQVQKNFGKDWGRVPAGKRWECAKKELINYENKLKKGFKVIKGHMDFGYHQYMPVNCTYITFLRDPVERIASLYDYILGLKNHNLKRKIESEGLSLMDFVKSGLSLENDNGMSRQLSGIGDSVEFGGCSLDILNRAKKNVDENFSFVGLTEEFDKSIEILKSLFNWKDLTYKRKNITNNKEKKRELTNNEIEAIKNYNQLDLKLYEYVQNRFSQEVF